LGLYHHTLLDFRQDDRAGQYLSSRLVLPGPARLEGALAGIGLLLFGLELFQPLFGSGDPFIQLRHAPTSLGGDSRAPPQS
jgi:hypothetical protein